MSSQSKLDDGWSWGRETEENTGSVLDRAGIGAAYTGTGGVEGQQDDSDHIDTTCQYCGSTVSYEYVRVMGVGGQVEVCPTCRSQQSKTAGGGI